MRIILYISWFFIAGYIVSALMLVSSHDAGSIATAHNAFLYGMLCSGALMFLFMKGVR